MTLATSHRIRNAARWAEAGLGLAAAGYAATAGATWLRYGHPAPSTTEDGDAWLDRFMPVYDVVERHHVRVAAPAAVTLSAAADADLERSPIVRGIIRTRELLLGARREPVAHPQGLLPFMTSIGWGVLAQEPGREVVFGAVTQPWKANVVFRAVPPEDFADFGTPGYVKIVWTLRADPVSATESVFLTETRAVATDPTARRWFRRYWARFSPGIVLIRLLTLRMVKAEAERRART